MDILSGPGRGIRLARLAWLAALAATAACGTSPVSDAPAPATSEARSGARPEASAIPADRPRIVVLGDSLTAGYGIDPAEAFPAQLQKMIDAEDAGFEVVNMGVSGDTSAGGVRRLDWALEGDVRILIVALGGNDGLRGLSPEELKRNLERIIDLAQARGVEVLLCGMEAPPNFGPAYTSAFRSAYRTVAEDKQVVLLPFLLDGVAGVASLNQADGIHPTAEGARRVAELVWARLDPMLDAHGTR